MTSAPARQYYDQSTLYVDSGVAHDYQIRMALKQAILELESKLKKSFPCQYKVNVVTLRDGIKPGYAYVHVDNSEVYYALTGRNLDGSPRVEYVADPDWVAPVDVDVTGSIKDMDWADVAEEEARLECPKIKKVLPPLVKLPNYTLDDSQREEYRVQWIANARRCGTYKEGDEPVIPESAPLVASGAYVQDLSESVLPHVLCAKKVPMSITEQKLKEIFSRYASDTKTIVKRSVNKKIVEDTYPFVSFNADRTAFVTFDPMTRDGQFALLMTRKIDVPCGGGKRETLIFNHYYTPSGRR